MTISRVNGAGWGVGDKLTSAQGNSIDLNTTYALDKRSGQTDTLESVVTLTNAGRIVDSVLLGSDSNATITVGNANVCVRVTSAVTANRTYTFSASGVTTNESVTIFCESSFAYEITIKDQASATMFVLGNTSSSDGQWAEFKYIGGWRLYRGGQGSRLRSQTFTSTGTWTCPSGVTMAFAIGCGGGASGADGRYYSDVNSANPGGGGGGGAMLLTIPFSCTPASVYDVTIGAGGTAPTINANQNGNDGSDTIISLSGGNVAVFRGAQGGKCGATFDPSIRKGISFGGAPIRGTATPTNTGVNSTYVDLPWFTQAPGFGGCGITNNWGSTPAVITGGTNAVDTYAGGAGGTSDGTNSGSYYGGGKGGGGAAGPFGAGGAGGSGGNGNNAGPGVSAQSGASASANTGAGGGGGGGGGAGSGGAGTAGQGGAGGSGKVTIYWIK